MKYLFYREGKLLTYIKKFKIFVPMFSIAVMKGWNNYWKGKFKCKNRLPQLRGT